MIVQARSLAAAFALLIAFAATAAAQARYRTSGDCAGLPRIPVRTIDGLCVGLVAEGLGFARNVMPLPGGDILVVDMGRWVRDRGRVLRLRRNQGAPPAVSVVLQRLDRPHGIAPAPDGEVYIGTVGAIVAFAPDAPDPQASVRAVASGFPDTGRHLLTHLALDRDGALYVNVGSATDNCEAPASRPRGSAVCPEADGPAARGTIKRIVPGPAPVDARAVLPLVWGLRNSLALAVHAGSGLLVQGENSFDLPDADRPHDEINLIRPGTHYGWPYCYDMRQPVAGFPGYDCARTAPPHLLLPPHSAPLGMIYVPGSTIPGIAGEALVISLHGYRAQGHRIVAYAVDGDGVPRAPMIEVVFGWTAVRGERPRGAPVGLALERDGSILVAEDHNGTVLRIARER